jgi:probable rRNA maturation factor
MLEIDVVGDAPATPTGAEIVRLAELTAASGGVSEGHLAVQFVDAAAIAELNREHRDKDEPTDVLSFPIDGDDAEPPGPRELGDVVICPEHTSDLREAIVHGMLHLLGMDHETDAGEMLALQDELIAQAGG